MTVIREKRGVVRAMMAALATKPFLILAGVSGSGKTQLARYLAASLAAGSEEDGQYLRHMQGGRPLAELLPEILVQTGVAPDIKASDDPEEFIDIHPLQPPAGARRGQEEGTEEEIDRARQSYQDVLNNRVAFLAVRPDWKDARQMWGNYNPLTGLFYPTQAMRVVVHAFLEFIKLGDQAGRHFLILDEMNISRVEYYMSDILSLIETPASVTPDGKRRIGEMVTIHPFRNLLWTESPPRIGGEYTVSSEKTFGGRLDRSWAEALVYLVRGDSNMVVDAVDLDFSDVIDGADWHRLVPPKLCIPPNLAIVGTVNVDETTFAFAPKVLDRAFVVEFEEMDFDAVCRDWEGYDAIRDEILTLHAILEPAQLHFGYRVVKEFLEYLRATGEGWEEQGDFLIASKILPKIRGTEERVGPALRSLLAYCLGVEAEALQNALTSARRHGAQMRFEALVKRLGQEKETIPHRRSARRVLQMLQEAEQTGVTSFL